MKRFTRSLMLFIPFAMVLYVILICVWRDNIPNIANTNLTYVFRGGGHMFSRLKEADQTENVDILFLGSSHAYRGFDPRIFRNAGFSSFNLGSSAQSPMQTELLLKRYLKPMDPKIIIYEINPAAFATDGVESSLDLIANGRIDAATGMMVIRQKNIRIINTLIYAYYRQLFNRNKGLTEKPKKNNNDLYISGGYVENDATGFVEEKSKRIDLAIRPGQIESFENILSLIEEHGARLMLVQAPVTRGRYRLIGGSRDFDTIMRKHGEYYNFNEMIAMNDSLHFYDSHHLNKRGVRYFNEKLIDLLLTPERAAFNGE